MSNKRMNSINSASGLMVLIFPVVMSAIIVGVSAANMAGPAILTPPLSKQCDNTVVVSTTETSGTSTWFGIPTQRRYVSKSCSAESVLDVRRGGGDDDDTGTKTIYTPSSVSDLDALLIKAGNEQQLVVIDFTASWCGPCQTIAPKFQEMSEAMSNVMFIKIDVDACPDVAAKYNVSAMPTFIFIKSGEIIDRLMGANVDRLQEMIDEHK